MTDERGFDVVDTTSGGNCLCNFYFPSFRGHPRLLYIGAMIFTKALPPALREIRILCSQTGPASAGTRSASKCKAAIEYLPTEAFGPQTIHHLEIPSHQEA